MGTGAEHMQPRSSVEPTSTEVLVNWPTGSRASCCMQPQGRRPFWCQGILLLLTPQAVRMRMVASLSSSVHRNFTLLCS